MRVMATHLPDWLIPPREPLGHPPVAGLARRLARALALARYTADLLLPRVCVACSEPLAPGREQSGWCAPCLGSVFCPAARCRQCGNQSERSPCAACIAAPPPFTGTLVLGAYQPPLDGLIRALKFTREPWLATPLAAALAAHLAEPLRHQLQAISGPTAGVVMTAVPLSAERLARRGYNQSLLIARALSRQLMLPLDPRALRREQGGPPQSVLDPQARQRNVEVAFKARGAHGRVVVVIDDVMTTGATLSATARALRTAGSGPVVNLVVARPPHVQCGPGPP